MESILESLNLGTKSETIIVVAITVAIVQLLKKKTKLSATYLPWVALILGAVAGLAVFSYMGDLNYLNGALLGTLSGGFSSGLFDGLAPVIASAVTAIQTKKADKTTQAQTMQEQAISKAVADYMASKQGTASSGGESSETK